MCRVCDSWQTVSVPTSYTVSFCTQAPHQSSRRRCLLRDPDLVTVDWTRNSRRTVAGAGDAVARRSCSPGRSRSDCDYKYGTIKR